MVIVLAFIATDIKDKVGHNTEELGKISIQLQTLNFTNERLAELRKNYEQLELRVRELERQ